MIDRSAQPRRGGVDDDRRAREQELQAVRARFQPEGEPEIDRAQDERLDDRVRSQLECAPETRWRLDDRDDGQAEALDGVHGRGSRLRQDETVETDGSGGLDSRLRSTPSRPR